MFSPSDVASMVGSRAGLSVEQLDAVRNEHPPLLPRDVLAHLRFACRPFSLAKSLGLDWPTTPTVDDFVRLGTAVMAHPYARLLIVHPRAQAMDMWRSSSTCKDSRGH